MFCLCQHYLNCCPTYKNTSVTWGYVSDSSKEWHLVHFSVKFNLGPVENLLCMGQYIEAEQYVCFDVQSNCPAVWLEEMLLPINTRNLYVTKSSGLCAGNCCFSLSQPVILYEQWIRVCCIWIIYFRLFSVKPWIVDFDIWNQVLALRLCS